MGMYDSINVSQDLILEATKDTDLLFEPYKGYYNFQTKDLDNSLINYYIEADGSFYWKKQEYKWIEPDPNAKDRKFNFGHMEPVGEPEIIEDTRTSYIEFYDVYSTDTERLFVTFIAHVKCGKLAEPIALKSIERTDLEKEANEFKLHRAKWDKAQATWQWRLASFISSAKWKLSKLFRPISNRIEKLERDLREKARKMYDLP